MQGFFGIVEQGVVFRVSADEVDGGDFCADERAVCAVFGPGVTKKLAYLISGGIEHGVGSAGFVFVTAQVCQNAALAVRFTGFADVAPMQDEPVVGVFFEFVRGDFK